MLGCGTTFSIRTPQSGVDLAAVFAVGDPIEKVIGQNRFTNEITLGLIASQVAQQVPGFLIFNTFGDNSQTKIMTQFNNLARER
jgi:hypothetical protein